MTEEFKTEWLRDEVTRWLSRLLLECTIGPRDASGRYHRIDEKIVEAEVQKQLKEMRK